MKELEQELEEMEQEVKELEQEVEKMEERRVEQAVDLPTKLSGFSL